MKFKLPEAVTRTVATTVLKTKKNSPTILFAGGVVGVVTTTVLACKATLKVEGVLEEAQTKKIQAKTVFESKHPDYSENDYKKDMTVLYIQSAVSLTKLYAPAVILGAISIGMLTKSHSIQRSRIAGLTAAYAALEKGFREYRGRVVDEYGEEKDRELRFGKQSKSVIVEDKNGPKKKAVKTVGDGGGSIYSKLFDEYNPNWSPNHDYNVVFLRGVQRQLNDQLRAKGHLFLNDAYRDLGLDDTKAGAVTGWLWDPKGKDGRDSYVDFGIFDGPDLDRIRDFMMGDEGAVWLDFNVDGIIYDKI